MGTEDLPIKVDAAGSEPRQCSRDRYRRACRPLPPVPRVKPRRAQIPSHANPSSCAHPIHSRTPAARLGQVKLVAPPLYVMLCSALDKTQGIQLMADAIDTMKSEIKKSKGELQVKVAPRAVDERDDKLLRCAARDFEWVQV